MKIFRRPYKITKEQADQIIVDWNKGNNPHRRVVCVWRGQWYDLRELIDPQEVNAFLLSLTGIKPTPKNTANIEIKL